MFVSCGEKEIMPIAVTGISISHDSIVLTEGETYSLIATICPDDAENKKVIWTSSDISIVTVSQGVVCALSAGIATITVTTEDGGFNATCEVTVKEKVYPVTGVSLDRTSVELTEGDVTTLVATITPTNASNKNVSWTSSDPEVATVEDGRVTAHKVGTATITVRTEDGDHTATCTITVKPKDHPVIGVSLDKQSLEITVGEESTLTATVSPANASNPNVVWSSSDSSVATVSRGKVTGTGAGTATITATTEDGGYTATCEVTVKEKVYPVTGVSLDRSTVELPEGDVTTLVATITPTNATNKNVVWTSSDTDVATVDAGQVTAHNVGTAKITVITEDGNHVAECIVNVIPRTYPVTGISINQTSAELKKGETIQLSATIAPDHATNQNVIWSTSDSTIATVVNGLVTAINTGTAIITVTSEDGGHTSTCSITVKPDPDVTIGDWENDGADDGGTAE